MKSTNEAEAVSSGNQGQTQDGGQIQIKIAPRWAAMIGLLAIGVLYLFLPQRLRIGPNWLLLATEVVALLSLTIIVLPAARAVNILGG